MFLSKRKKNRWEHYNYSNAGYYFVTICVQDRICNLGTVTENGMDLNEYGKIVQHCWTDLPNHYVNCTLDSYQIMPNHIHGIIIIQPLRDGYKPSPTDDHGLSEIIRGFKTFSSKNINKISPAKFAWQRSYYDHVIRKEESLDKIRQYIVNNPKQWELDELNPTHP